MSLPLKLPRAHFLVRPWLSLVLVDTPVNKETQTLVNVMEKGVTFRVIHRSSNKWFELLHMVLRALSHSPHPRRGALQVRHGKIGPSAEWSVSIYT
jgi:hypothetical protein